MHDNPCFPRHRAAASLKRDPTETPKAGGKGFPRHRAAASLKQDLRTTPLVSHRVFRGIGPRPH